MTQRLIVAEQAEVDIESIARLIGDAPPSAARRFLLAIEKSLDLIATFPEIGGAWRNTKPKLEGIRALSIPRFNKYVVFFASIPTESASFACCMDRAVAWRIYLAVISRNSERAMRKSMSPPQSPA
jgi:plasmid stabilization system protein ParE